MTSQRRVLQSILELKPPHMDASLSEPVHDVLRSSKLTYLWKNRRISNFEYLLQLNRISGRTFNVSYWQGDGDGDGDGDGECFVHFLKYRYDCIAFGFAGLKPVSGVGFVMTISHGDTMTLMFCSI